MKCTERIVRNINLSRLTWNMPGALQEAEAVTNLNQIMKSIILTPGPEAWSTFRKLCKARGWIYQTLANQRKIPKIGEATEINGETIQRVKIN